MMKGSYPAHKNLLINFVLILVLSLLIATTIVVLSGETISDVVVLGGVLFAVLVSPARNLVFALVALFRLHATNKSTNNQKKLIVRRAQVSTLLLGIVDFIVSAILFKLASPVDFFGGVAAATLLAIWLLVSLIVVMPITDYITNRNFIKKHLI